MLIRRYRRSVLWEPEEQQTAHKVSEVIPKVESVRIEHCF